MIDKHVVENEVHIKFILLDGGVRVGKNKLNEALLYTWQQNELNERITKY